uniref:Uncharacterized protein n=1 Tax=Rhizophora mucronata TaxID=61149 RepID=A0A2P2NP42_RHIMU
MLQLPSPPDTRHPTSTQKIKESDRKKFAEEFTMMAIQALIT